MPDTFNFRQSYTLLGTNPKTFQDWLKKAGIDTSTQVNRADQRERYLTRAQVVLLAELHGRTLPALDDEAADAGVTLDTLAQYLTGIQDQLAQLEHGQRALTEQLLAMQHSFTQVEQALQKVLDLAQTSSERNAPSLSSSAEDSSLAVEVPSDPESLNQAHATVVAAKRVPTKRKNTSKGKALPRTLIPLRVFAEVHQIGMKGADRASKSGKIKVMRGRWMYNSRVVAEALDVAGQRSFYEWFHASEGFVRCEQCPHGAG